MKSMKIFLESKKSSYGLKISGFNYSFSDNIFSAPFYGIEGILRKEK